MIKKKLLLSALILSVVSSNTFSMFKKFTQPAQDALKNEFASTFNFSKIMPESFNTLIAHNKSIRNNAIVRLLLITPLAIAATLARIDMTTDEYYRNNNRRSQKNYDHFEHLMTPQTEDRQFVSFIWIASLAYAAKKGHTAYTRQWIIHHLQKVKNNS